MSARYRPCRISRITRGARSSITGSRTTIRACNTWATMRMRTRRLMKASGSSSATESWIWIHYPSFRAIGAKAKELCKEMTARSYNLSLMRLQAGKAETSLGTVRVRSNCLRFRRSQGSREAKKAVQAPTQRKSSRPKTLTSKLCLHHSCKTRSISTRWTRTITRVGSGALRHPMLVTACATRTLNQH